MFEVLVSQGPTYNIHRESKCCLWKLTRNPWINPTTKVQGFITMQIHVHVHVPPCLFRPAVCLLSVSNPLQLKENFFWKFSQTVVYTVFICNIFLLVLRVFLFSKASHSICLHWENQIKFNVNGRAPLFCVEGKNGGKPFYCRRA